MADYDAIDFFTDMSIVNESNSFLVNGLTQLHIAFDKVA